MAGQVAYHLLAQAGAARAPWPITMFVSCLPVLVLAMGAALVHMLRADAGPGHGTRGPAAGRPPARSHDDQARPSPDQTASAGTPAKPDLPPGQQRSRGRTTTPALRPIRRVRPRPARYA